MGYKIYTDAADCSRMKVTAYDNLNDNHLRVKCSVVCSINPIIVNYLLDKHRRRLYDKNGNVLTLRINGI